MKNLLLMLLATAILTGCGKPITIKILRQKDFVQHILDSQPQTQGKGKVTIDKQNNLLIEIDVSVSDSSAFRTSFETIRKGTSDYIKQEACPFIVKTRNETFFLPQK